jgi:aminoglycoside phosphotransferase (APT) family kinase protein
MNDATPALEPPVEQLLGSPCERVDTLLNYGYRAAWKVLLRGEWFLVKSDAREGFQTAEVRAGQHAWAHGIPAPEVVAVTEQPIASAAFRWVEGVALGSVTDPRAWESAGRTLRGIHELPVLTPRLEPWSETVLRSLEELAAYLVDRRGLESGVAHAAVTRATGLATLLDAQRLVWLHGDCQPDHFIMDPRSLAVAAVVDWADARHGDAAMDFAVLAPDDEHRLPLVLAGYQATAEFRQYLRMSLPLYQTWRAAASAKWLDEHGYPGRGWPLDAVRAFARSS